MLDQDQYDHFRERQVLSLTDTCHRLVHSYSTNDLNEKVSSWSENSTDIPCGLQQSGNERRRSNDTLVSYDAVIRLPFDTTMDVKDRIKITYRFGGSIDPIIYEIVSPIEKGPSGIRLLLKKIEL